MLATDGAVNTARHLGLDDWPALARSGPAALARLLRACQDWEQHADPDGQQFPRSKRHDDKAIASLDRRPVGPQPPPRPRASARCSQPLQGRSDPPHRLRPG